MILAGSPRHMYEYSQDAMTYIRNYGHNDLFITFIRFTTWNEIKKILFPGQLQIDRHDITIRLLRQKISLRWF